MNTLDYLKGQFDMQKLWLDERFTTLHKAIDEGKAVDKEQNERLDRLEKGKFGGLLVFLTAQVRRLFNGM